MMIALLAQAGLQHERKCVDYRDAVEHIARRHMSGKRVETDARHVFGIEFDLSRRADKRLFLEIAESIGKGGKSIALEIVERDTAALQQIGVEFGLVGPRNKTGLRGAAGHQTLDQPKPDLKIGFDVTVPFCSGTRIGHARRALMDMDLLLFDRCRFGKNDVGPGGSRRHGMGCDHEDVEALQCLDRPRRIRIGHRDVDATRKQRAHGIRAPGQHRIDHGRVVTRHLIAKRTRPQRKFFGADSLGLNIRRQPKCRIEQDVEIGLEARRLLATTVTTDPVDVAADADQAVVGAKRLHTVGGRIDPVAADEA
jgi:hypothetical protein